MMEIPQKHCPVCGGIVTPEAWEVTYTKDLLSLSGKHFRMFEESRYRFHCKTCNKLFEIKEYE